MSTPKLTTEVTVEPDAAGYGFRVVLRIRADGNAVEEQTSAKRYWFRKDADARADKLRATIKKVAKRARSAP